MSVMLTEPKAVTSSNYVLLPAGQFYETRRGKIKGAVVHVTAGLQDLGMVGDDPSAEGTNRWALNSHVEASWYRIADSDGVEVCLPSWYTAWQAKGYNSTTVGNECSNVDARWDNKPAEWVKWTIWHYARSYADWVVKYKIPMRRATKAELDHAIATDGPPVGFVDHSRLSTIRSDPGATFPWSMFFRFMAAIIAGATHPDNLNPQEDDVPLSDQLIQRPEPQTPVPADQAISGIMMNAYRTKKDTTAILAQLGGLESTIGTMLELLQKQAAGVVLPSKDEILAQVRASADAKMATLDFGGEVTA